MDSGGLAWAYPGRAGFWGDMQLQDLKRDV